MVLEVHVCQRMEPPAPAETDDAPCPDAPMDVVTDLVPETWLLPEPPAEAPAPAEDDPPPTPEGLPVPEGLLPDPGVTTEQNLVILTPAFWAASDRFLSAISFALVFPLVAAYAWHRP